MPLIVIFILLVGAGWILVSWFQMLYGSYKGFPRAAGMPLPMIGHSYKFLCPLEELWPTAQKIIADFDPDERMVIVKLILKDAL